MQEKTINPEQLLEVVAEAIEKRNKHNIGPFHLCYWENQIQCLKPNHTDTRHEVFMKINQYIIKDGFTTGQWVRLQAVLTNFFKESNPCHQPQKP